MQKYKIGILVTHPIQYYIPLYRALERKENIELQVFFCLAQSPKGQSDSGFGVEFEWDTPLFEGYNYRFLKNLSRNPSSDNFFGCDNPDIIGIIAKGNFDAFIVQGWYVKSYWQAFYACRRFKVPLVVRGDSTLDNSRNLMKRAIKYPLYNWFIPKFDAYLYVGKKSRNYYKYYGAEESKMFFTPHAVDNEFFIKENVRLSPKKSQLRKDYGLRNDSIVFLFVGKLIDIKRPLDFLKAIKMLHRRNKNIFGLMVGDGELKLQCDNYIATNNLPVKMTGFINQSKLPEIYTLSDVLVMTSESETWGLVVNEAMCSGLAIILNDMIGCKEDLLVEDITGKSYSKGNINELSEKMYKMSSNLKKLSAIKNSNKEYIMKYSISANVESITNALEFIIGKKQNYLKP